MSRWVLPPVAGFTDQGTAPVIYADNIGAISYANGNLRVFVVAEQVSIAGQAPHMLVTGEIVGPALSVPRAMRQLANCLWLPRAKGPWPHLVR